jgi:hypothetical protein
MWRESRFALAVTDTVLRHWRALGRLTETSAADLMYQQSIGGRAD